MPAPPPDVTAVMAVYNEERYVEGGVRSLLDQDLPDGLTLEVVAVSDGSTDGTGAVLDRLAAEDDRLRVFHRPRSNQATCLAFAAEQARGRYVTNLDADDEALPGRLAKQAAFLDEHPKVGWLGTGERRVDQDSGEATDRLLPTDDAAIRRLSARCIPYVHSSVMFRRSLVERGVNYDPEQAFMQDFEFFLRAAAVCEVANLPEVLTMRRIRRASFYQSSLKKSRYNRRLSVLSARAVRQFGLPAWYLAFPAARLGYIYTPESVRRTLRRVGGLTVRPAGGGEPR
ncbi:glycosyltransferase family 2 protein [Alienimonas sp. DA493]|uniref:glycosyltransferase family 2 protein n=1 Tax=Alienimonas sp. DA493 TaxID=3373605 RepID=UPI003753EFF6